MWNAGVYNDPDAHGCSLPSIHRKDGHWVLGILQLKRGNRLEACFRVQVAIGRLVDNVT